jgi:uncharacterized protein (DUF2062 family)
MSKPSQKSRLSRWIASQIPSREQLEEIRYVRPLARRTELFRLTRRSVPRGVAVGLLVGIFALIPGIQIIGAALMCVPFRGNIPLAAGMTFLSNPATTPFILAASIYVGNSLGFHADIATFNALYNEGASGDFGGSRGDRLSSVVICVAQHGSAQAAAQAEYREHQCRRQATGASRRWAKPRRMSRAAETAPGGQGAAYGELGLVAAALVVTAGLIWALTGELIVMLVYVGALIVVGAIAYVL